MFRYYYKELQTISINYIFYSNMVLVIDLSKDLLFESGDKIVITLDGQLDKCSYKVNKLPCSGEVSISQSPPLPTLAKYIESLSARLCQNGKHRLAETYGSTLRSFMAFRQEDLAVNALNKEIVEDYECYLRRKGLTLNTVSFYLKRLRAIYNKAQETFGFPNLHPFAYAFTKATQTAKRALTTIEIQKIANAETYSELESLAKDLFLFSYYTRGMSFVDIASLKKSDIRNGCLIYKRKKTGQELRMAWRECMQEIVDRHPSLDGVHLLGILDATLAKDIRKQCHYIQCRINQALKKITDRMDISKHVTMYCARHSWATIANEQNVPINIISESMGHKSERTTRIYLKSINADKIDRYNDLLIKAIQG